MSHQKALMEGNMDDALYFQSIMDGSVDGSDGYQYISIDGNNRTQAIKHYVNTTDFTINNDETREVFKRLMVVTQTYMGITRLMMHDAASILNKQKSWNHQESRNPIPTVVADYVRDVSKTIDTSTDKIKIKKNRMGDDEFIAQTLFYEVNQTGPTQRGLNMMYREKINTSIHKKNILIWDKLVRNHTIKKLGKSASFNLYNLVSYLTKNNLTISKDKYKDFYNDYFTKEQIRWAGNTFYDTGKGEQLTWSKLNGSMEKNLTMKLEKILKDFTNLSDYVVEKDTQRAFSIKQKVTMWLRDNGMVRVNGSINGVWFDESDKTEYKQVSLIEALNGKEYICEHIDPHSKGGLTDIDNGEITSSKYNSWKSDKVELV
jgi:hypothetical protein